MTKKSTLNLFLILAAFLLPAISSARAATAVQPYADGIISSISPAEGESIAGLLPGDQVTVKFDSSIEDIATVLLSITDSNGKFIASNSSWQAQGDNTYVWNVQSSYPFYEGVDYVGTFTLFADQMRQKVIDKATVTWKGNAPSPRSQTTFVGTNPSMDKVLGINEDGTASFTVNFSAPVTISEIYCPGGQGVRNPVTTYSQNGDASSWNITVPKTAVETCLQNYNELRVIVVAIGEDGLTVYTTSEENGEVINRAFVLVTYDTSASDHSSEYMDCMGTVVYPDLAQDITYISGIQVAWDYQFLTLVAPRNNSSVSSIPVTLTIENEGTFSVYPTLVTLTEGDAVPASNARETFSYSALYIDFSNIVEDYKGLLPNGKYTISLPEGVVQNANGQINMEQDFVYNVMSPYWGMTQVNPPMVEDDSYIDYSPKELADVTVEFDGLPLMQNDHAQPLSCKVNGIDYDLSDDVFVNENSISLRLSSLDEGVCDILIPEAFVFILDNGTTRLSPETYVTYHIVSSTTAVSDLGIDVDGIYRVYDLNGVKILETDDPAALRILPAGLYIINGHKLLLR